MNSRDVFISLDIGTSTVKVIIGEMVNDQLNIIGVGNVESEGIRKGSIVDIDHTVHSIRRTIEQAERMIGMDIRQVIVGVPAHQVLLRDCHGVVAVSGENKEITDEDVERVMEAAQVVSIPHDREIINVVTKQFIVDSRDEINDPRGMIGVRLEMEGLLVTGPRTSIMNILRCVERAGLQIADIVLQPLAAGEIALSRDEKNLGSALIDLGGGTTTVSFFEDGYIKGTAVIPLGGNHITKDISIVLKTPTKDAEEIKIKYGHACYDLASEEEQFFVPVIGSNQKQEFNQLDLAEIIEARLVEIFMFAKEELARMGANDLPGGIVLTGGTANMQGILELAQNIFQNRVRIAIPDYIGVREPQYTAAVGIIQYSYRNARFINRYQEAAVAPLEPRERRAAKNPSRGKNGPSEEKLTTKMKKFFGSFFE
jgi:cell division protein FtsA